MKFFIAVFVYSLILHIIVGMLGISSDLNTVAGVVKLIIIAIISIILAEITWDD